MYERARAKVCVQLFRCLRTDENLIFSCAGACVCMMWYFYGEVMGYMWDYCMNMSNS